MATGKRLAIIGCGPKALAIAAKTKVLREIGIADIEVVIFEKSSVASHWTGKCGYTDGQQTLGTLPEKDIGFPYKSEFGSQVDHGMIQYSWHSYLISKTDYGPWIDRGRPHPHHAEWAAYLKWVAEKTGVEIRYHEVVGITPLEHGFRLAVENSDEKLKSWEADVFSGVVFTGPGEPLKIHDHPTHKWNEDIVNGRNFWQRVAVFSALDDAEVAIVGSGETAASIVVALLREAPDLKIYIINRHGTLYTRGESYHENRYFTDPKDWEDLALVDREDFMRRTDRGVFSVASKQEIDHAKNLTVITGNVKRIENAGDKVDVHVQRLHGKGYQTFVYKYDKIIVAIGFDALTPLELFPDHLRSKNKLKDIRSKIDYHLRIPLLDTDTLEDAPPMNIHLPMLAGLSQGPGFPNLSCLGTLSDRILGAYIETSNRAT